MYLGGGEGNISIKILNSIFFLCYSVINQAALNKKLIINFSSSFGNQEKKLTGKLLKKNNNN